MATFKTVVQKQRRDGFYLVYIRVTHNRYIGFIKTDKLVNQKGLSKHNEVIDPYVLKSCLEKITDYVDRLNKKEISSWSVKDIIEYLVNGDDDISFSGYARKHCGRMIDNGQARNARNYELALQHLERFKGTTNVMFSHLTSTFVSKWITSLEKTKRAKEMYPICMRQVFKAACVELNDYDNGNIKIKTNPWIKVKIPNAERPEKLAITPEECRSFFSAPLPENKFKSPLPELGRDVAMMVLCLAGINTIDLYQMQKTDYYDGIIHYKRAKTKKFRADEAYIEMKVPPILLPIFNKYLSDEKDSYLFIFHKRHTTSDSFGANVNIGIRKMCESMNLLKGAWYCCYTFRHTWGTVAQNDCGASIEDVAFAMNHSSGHKVTRGYLKIDFSPAWVLNEKVVDFIFFTEQVSKREEKDDENIFSRFSAKYMMRGGAYFRGKLLGEICDIGFNNVDEIISKLTDFVTEEIPKRSMIQFKIENMDKGQVAIYERMKQ